MSKSADEPDVPQETREQYCERVQREHAERIGRRDFEIRRRAALEERFGAQLDALPESEMDALARAVLLEGDKGEPSFFLRYYLQDRTRVKRWLIRGPMLIGLSRMMAAAARET